MKKLLLLLLLVACKKGDAHVDTEATARWTNIPLRVAVSTVTPCQEAALHASAAYWETLIGRELFQFDSSTVNDTVKTSRPVGTVFVLAGPMDTPDILDQTELVFVKGSTELLHSAEMRIAGCSVRAYTHEFGHALGFMYHAKGKNALMQIEHYPDAYEVSPAEISSLLRQLPTEITP